MDAFESSYSKIVSNAIYKGILLESIKYTHVTKEELEIIKNEDQLNHRLRFIQRQNDVLGCVQKEVAKELVHYEKMYLDTQNFQWYQYWEAAKHAYYQIETRIKEVIEAESKIILNEKNYYIQKENDFLKRKFLQQKRFVVVKEDIMIIFHEGLEKEIVFGIIQYIKESSVVFSVHKEPIEIFVSDTLLTELKEIYQENEHAAIPIQLETETVILDGYVPEMKLGNELKEADLD